MSTAARELEKHLSTEIGKVVFGMPEVIHYLTLAYIADGHILLQSPPGLGKTLVAKTFASILGEEFKRIQGTADLMPSDLTGVTIYNAQQGQFQFVKGPLFANVVLLDEINRTGPKTQSALLEAMEERRITVDRTTYNLPDTFILIASQNPADFEGTFPLPESQLDRFLLRLNLEYPDQQVETSILKGYSRITRSGHTTEATLTRIDPSLLQTARQQADEILLSDALYEYIQNITQATRQHPLIHLGLSSRGALALARCARVEAALDGADFVTPDHVKTVANQCIAHRIIPSTDAIMEGHTPEEVVGRILESVEVPRQ